MKKTSSAKGKKNWKNRHNKGEDVRLPNVLFFWEQPSPELTTPWYTLWPQNGSFDTYIDPLLGDGMGWSRAGEWVQSLFVNDPDQEMICALRTVVRADSNLRQHLREWVRLYGNMDEWAKVHAAEWALFHVEQVKNQWEDPLLIKQKALIPFTVTLSKLLNIQTKDFPHQSPFFEEALKASLVAILRKAYHLAQQNNAPLPVETLEIELKKAMNYAALLYTQRLYQLSFKVGNFQDPHHALTYLILRSIAKKDSTGAWRLRSNINYESYEKSFRTFESPLIQTLGRQTHFQHSDPCLFMRQLPKKLSKPFIFAKTPAGFSKEQFAELYDCIWQMDASFLLVCPEETAQSINHLGGSKTWTAGGESWVAMNNYSQPPAEDFSD
jgi:hypothetical protein